MIILAKFTRACAVALSLFLVLLISNHVMAMEEDRPAVPYGINAELGNDVEMQDKNRLNLANGTGTNESHDSLANCGNFVSTWCDIPMRYVSHTCTSLVSCTSSTCDYLAVVAFNPHLWAHIIGISLVVTGGSMMGIADVTWESDTSTCTDDTKYYDDDYTNGHHHRHGHSHTHSCTVTVCKGPGCSQYYGGMALLIVGGIIVLGDWAVILKCDHIAGNAAGNFGRGHGRNGHNVHFDPHHNHGHNHRRGW